MELRVRRHALPSRAPRMQASRGTMVWDEQRLLPCAIEFEAAGTAGPVRFRSSEITWVDSLRFDVAGQLTVGDIIAPTDLRVHDLGWLPDADHGRRRIFAVRMSTQRRTFAPTRRLRLRDLIDDRSLDVIVHAEWVPDMPLSAA
jgi:hypothetical protein